MRLTILATMDSDSSSGSVGQAALAAVRSATPAIPGFSLMDGTKFYISTLFQVDRTSPRL